MKVDIKVPSPGESITEVQIAEWLVADGDHVEENQDVVEIDSDKATLSIAAPSSGKIKITVEVGETVEINAIIAEIDTDAVGNKPEFSSAKATEDKEVSSSAKATEDKKVSSSAKATEDKMVKAEVESKVEKNASSVKTEVLNISPVARKLMAEKDLSEDDLIEFLKHQRFGKADIEQIRKSQTTASTTAITKSWSGSRETQSKKMTSLRKKLSQRLVSVKNETAMLTTFNEVNMTPIMGIRKKYKEAFAKHHDINLGFMSFFTKAVTEALAHFPQVNSQINGDEVVSHDYVDVSIAISAPKGLVVPVLRNAESMNLAEIEKEIKNLAIKARDNKLTLNEMTGGTFTITNGGVFGSMLSTPIINPPQSAILGMHNIVERPIAVNGKVEIHPMMYIALSYDHRIIDGRESVSFLVKVKEMLESPEKMLFGAKDPVEVLLGL